MYLKKFLIFRKTKKTKLIAAAIKNAVTNTLAKKKNKIKPTEIPKKVLKGLRLMIFIFKVKKNRI
jgi:hypothetical protein